MEFRRLHLGTKSRTTADRQRHAQNYYVLASRHIEQSDWTPARDLLRKALEINPTHFLALRALANLEYSSGNLHQARMLLDRLLDTHPADDGDTCFLQGNIELSEGQIALALRSYQRAEEADGATPELAYNRGLAYLMLGQGEPAAQIFANLLEAQPENARAWDALGCARRLQKEYTAATHAFMHALALDTRLNDARDHLAQMLLEMGNPREAQQVLDAALAIDPERASSRHLLGLAFSALHDYPRAIACWEALLAQGGAQAETFHLLADAYLRTNDRQRALHILQTMVNQYPHHLGGRLQLALLLLENGEFEQGWRHLEHARAIDPRNPTVLQLVSAANAMRDIRDR